MGTEPQQRAYPALFVVPKMTERDDGVHVMANVPSETEVLDIVTNVLEDAGWSASNAVVDVRRGERKLQDEHPPADRIDVDGVTIVFDQLPAPEAEGYPDGPFVLAKAALGEELNVEVWIDAVTR